MGKQQGCKSGKHFWKAEEKYWICELCGFKTEKMPLGTYVKKELASYIGITLCSKCGTRTKMKRIKPHSRDNIAGIDTFEGYTVCPKCGHKERWMDGDAGTTF